MKKIIPILFGAIVFQLINYIGMQFLKRETVLWIEVLLFMILASMLWLTKYKKNRS
ncbi:MAG: hypothetical protein JEZ08_23420 [Clostridiales bacterium]|nr:hypothetical protein [Clostridiales bacterium]